MRAGVEVCNIDPSESAKVILNTGGREARWIAPLGASAALACDPATDGHRKEMPCTAYRRDWLLGSW